ncbi:hypothetical protein BDV36DRAFT_297381 [Aspergillus pseudocaelatus]|uniref:Uncharacterized protein n=1 Tax=Aspergillus pseudocaelatus TaxID=1825620 RepID=A0ABQ6WG75_9EURO|nr:hypothetical protein BDV36DRAFT_297381 [Aspergillus pseudocaelatus]
MKIQTLLSLATVGLTFASPIQNLEERDTRPDDCTLREEWTTCLAQGVDEVTDIWQRVSNFRRYLQTQYDKCYDSVQSSGDIESVPGLLESIENNSVLVGLECSPLAGITSTK